MEPLFFGESTKPLYGVYHPPSVNQYRNQGVLLCYPAGQEYLRLHRAYRQLASMLANKGYHVLRFDFSGTGDSSGNQEDITYNSWLEDIEVAAEELQAMTGVADLYIVGARLGSMVSVAAAEKIKVKKLVLWEPYLECSTFFEEMKERIKIESDDSNFFDDNNGFHYNGFYFSEKCINSFSKVGINTLDWSGLSVSVLLISAEDGEILKDVYRSLDAAAGNNKIIKKQVDCVADWNELDAMGGLFLPQQTLSVITDWIEEA